MNKRKLSSEVIIPQKPLSHWAGMAAVVLVMICSTWGVLMGAHSLGKWIRKKIILAQIGHQKDVLTNYQSSSYELTRKDCADSVPPVYMGGSDLRYRMVDHCGNFSHKNTFRKMRDAVENRKIAIRHNGAFLVVWSEPFDGLDNNNNGLIDEVAILDSCQQNKDCDDDGHNNRRGVCSPANHTCLVELSPPAYYP